MTGPPDGMPARPAGEPVRLRTIAREWGRIGVVGFGGPPAHIALLRDLVVVRRGWLADAEFTDGVAACNLLPGPASTQLAIFCAWRLRGWRGALLGGACFILPGLAAIIVLAALFLAGHPPRAVLGAAAGAGAAVPAVAIHAAAGLLPAAWQRAGAGRGPRSRFIGYAAAGATAAALVGPWLVLVLVACGLVETAVRRPAAGHRGAAGLALPVLASAGVWASLAWVALKVGALSYGGGFVIIPLMQHDAVQTYHWMTGAQFLTAVALGQVTPGPVVQTVAVVGYAAAGVLGALFAAVIAFAPSFVFVLAGGSRFDALRRSDRVRAFMTGAGPAAIGAIAGAAIPLATSLAHLWQAGLLAAAVAWLLVARRGVVSTIVGAALVGLVAVLLGAPVG